MIVSALTLEQQFTGELLPRPRVARQAKHKTAEWDCPRVNAWTKRARGSSRRRALRALLVKGTSAFSITLLIYAEDFAGSPWFFEGALAALL